MATRIFLGFVGIAYLVFSAWCSIKPAKTASAVGFELRSGTGQSEYLVVYGGLQFALGCIFLLPFLRPEFQRYALVSCLIIHASLVLFRAASLLMYGRLESTTYGLAGFEFLLFLIAAVLYWKN